VEVYCNLKGSPKAARVPEPEAVVKRPPHYNVNGIDYTFNNCDGHANSYIVFYFNPDGISYADNGDSTVKNMNSVVRS
jgi:hypothetical protein